MVKLNHSKTKQQIKSLQSKDNTKKKESQKEANSMKKYRITVFHDHTQTETYFDNKDEALDFGRIQSKKQNTTAVFLLSHLIDNKYDVEMQIQ